MFERLKHMLIKEFIQVGRDPRMKVVIFLIPCVQVLVIGYAVSNDVQHVPTAIYDLDNSVESRELTARFIRSGYFDATETVGSDAPRAVPPRPQRREHRLAVQSRVRPGAARRAHCAAANHRRRHGLEHRHDRRQLRHDDCRRLFAAGARPADRG